MQMLLGMFAWPCFEDMPHMEYIPLQKHAPHNGGRLITMLRQPEQRILAAYHDSDYSNAFPDHEGIGRIGVPREKSPDSTEFESAP